MKSRIFSMIACLLSVLTLSECSSMQVDQSKSNADAIAMMAKKAVKVCGKGNVKKVTIESYVCFR